MSGMTDISLLKEELNETNHADQHLFETIFNEDRD